MVLEKKWRQGIAWVDRLPAGWVIAVATLGPIGRRLPAPGTWGTLVGVGLVAVMLPYLSWIPAAVAELVLLYLAVAFCDGAERQLQARDPGCIILDEVAATPLCFIGVMEAAAQNHWPLWGMLLAGFLLFRVFDIAKPLGIRRLQEWPGGLGVVVDDVAAALASAMVLNVLVRL
jgi:phosphatidylglycerophosphatase A